MKSDRGAKPRGKAPRGAAPARKPRPADDKAGFRSAGRRDFAPSADPYRPAKRPMRASGGQPRDEREGGQPRGPFPPRGGFGGHVPGRGFTVKLDPDVARVFRGDAAVNRALRLVLQLMHVVQGPPRPPERVARGGYQGSPQARGFTRRPRFESEDEGAEIEE